MRCVAKIAAVLPALLLALGALARTDIALGIMIIWAVAHYSSQEYACAGAVLPTRGHPAQIEDGRKETEL